MLQRRVIVGLFVLASALVDLTCARLDGQGNGRESLWLLLLALMITQSATAGVWLALGNTPGPLRLIGTMLIVGFWAAATWNVRGPDWHMVLLWASMFPTILTALPLFGLRPFGLHIVDRFCPDEHVARFQFSLGRLMGWTTVIAVAMSALTSASFFRRQDLFEGISWNDAVAVVVVPAVLTWTSVWALLGFGLAVARICVFLAVIVASSVALVSPHMLGAPLVLGLPVALLVPAYLAVFRIAGYRVRWLRGVARGPTASEQVSEAGQCEDAASTLY
jgi:hypothetical protein